MPRTKMKEKEKKKKKYTSSGVLFSIFSNHAPALSPFSPDFSHKHLLFQDPSSSAANHSGVVMKVFSAAFP